MRRVVSIFCFCFLLLQGNTQNIEAALTKFISQVPQEKIHIHFDKDHYTAGETIWFKAYLYHNGLPSSLSHNFYIQLINSAGSIIDKKVYPISGATVNGQIDIPASISQGDYYIRAATPLMLNYNEAFVYRTNFPIYNHAKPSTGSASESKPHTIQFFPEGGSLIDGSISVVGFKALDKWGHPTSVSGKIKSTSGSVIAAFKSGTDGIGKVQFKPLQGQSYFGEVELGDKKYTYPLPAVSESGVTIKVQDEKGGKLFQLIRSEKDKERFNNISLLVVQNNRVVYSREISFDDYLSVQGHLLTDSLPSGILHFTVFDAKGNPIAERLSFVNNKEYRFSPEPEILQNTSSNPALSSFKIKFPEGAQGSFSVSVTNAELTELPDKEHIFSKFLITSDLKGHIYNSARYFDNSSDSIRQAIDNLMLTQTWSKFQWSQVLGNEKQTVKFHDTYLRTLAGVVVDEKSGTPMSGGMLNLFLEAEDSTNLNYNIPVLSDGRFILDSMLFKGRGRIYYNYSQGKKSIPAKLILDKIAMDSLSIVLSPDWKDIKLLTPSRDPRLANIPATISKTTQQDTSEIIKLKEVTVESANKPTKNIANEKYATGVWKSGGRVVFEPSMHYNKTLNVIDYILQSLQNVKLDKGQFVNRRNFSLYTKEYWPMGAFLEENNVSLGNLQSIIMEDVGMIKFYEAGFVGVGTMHPGGAIAIYLKNPDTVSKVNLDKKLPFVNYSGYAMSRGFKTNNIASSKDKVLYWNPLLYPDTHSGTIDISFNHENTKKFKVVIEGFDSNGKLLHYERIIDSR